MIEIHTELHTNVTIGERGLDFGVLTEWTGKTNLPTMPGQKPRWLVGQTGLELLHYNELPA